MEKKPTGRAPWESTRYQPIAEEQLVKPFLCLTTLLMASAALRAAEPSVELTKKGDTVVVMIGGEEFTVFNTSREMPKPFFSPVRGPGGTVISRPLLKPGDDHPHHKGIWISVDEVNGCKHWAEKHRIENVSASALVAQGNPAKLQVVNHWLDQEGKPLLKETTVVSIFANRLMAYDITLTANEQTVTFGDTKEGLFGFRMVNSMREKDGGHVVNSKGMEGSQASWGKTWEWVDYDGDVEGKRFGVAIFDHPMNFRASRYHVRDYGLFSISPFGEHDYTGGKHPADPVILPASDSLRLRYAIYIHAGDTQAADVAGVYREYLKSTE